MEGDRDFCEEDSENHCGQGERDRDYHGGEDSEDEQGVGDSDDNISEDDTQDEHGGERDVMMDFSDGGEARKTENIQRLAKRFITRRHQYTSLDSDHSTGKFYLMFIGLKA